MKAAQLEHTPGAVLGTVIRGGHGDVVLTGAATHQVRLLFFTSLSRCWCVVGYFVNAWIDRVDGARTVFLAIVIQIPRGTFWVSLRLATSIPPSACSRQCEG